MNDHTQPEPDQSTPRELVYRVAGRFGLTQSDAREVVREVGFRIARMIVSGKMKDPAIVSRKRLAQITNWAIIDLQREKRRGTDGPSQTTQ